MTLHEFNSLSFEDKQTTLWAHGKFLDYFITREQRIKCYAIDTFFVEVHLDPIHNIIIDIKAFNDGEHLDKYTNLNL